MSWFIIDQLEEPYELDEILAFWIEDGLPAIGVLVYGPLWFAEESPDGPLTIDGPFGWTHINQFGIKRFDGTWQEEPNEIHPTHWMPLPDPPLPHKKVPTIWDVIEGSWP